MDWYLDERVSGAALSAFWDGMDEAGFEAHALEIAAGGKVVVRAARPPYTPRDVREVYSLSKLFTSTLCGIACDRGLMRDDDPVLKYFPEITDAPERFSRMTIRHLLSMNTGHDRCVMPDMCDAESSVRAFFAVEPAFEPGTHFTYNTGATCIAGQAISRAVGMDLFDFACEALFFPMGITRVSWNRTRDGACEAGTGLHICCDDMMKMGLLYANGGEYNGRQIVSREWIKKASSAVSDNSANSSDPDWRAGYGYQIWRNSRDGYRGDGAFGQLLMVLPAHDMVVALQAVGSNMQREIDCVMRLVDGLFGAGECGVRPYAPAEGEMPLLDATYRLDENIMGFKTLRVTTGAEGADIAMSDGTGVARIEAGRGTWVESEYRAKHMTPKIFGLMTTGSLETIRVSASCRPISGGIEIVLRYRSNPHTEVMRIVPGDVLQVEFLSPMERTSRPAAMRYLTGCRV